MKLLKEELVGSFNYLKDCSEKYYNHGVSLISDAEFDRAEKELLNAIDDNDLKNKIFSQLHFRREEPTNELNEILNLLLTIENTKGKGSQNIIKDLIKDNFSDDLEYVLNLALNPFILTHMSKVSDTSEKSTHKIDMKSFKTLIEKCTSVKAINNELRDEATKFINLFEGEEKRMITMLFTKSINIGLGAKLVNSAMKKSMGRNIIPVPSAMLADKGIERIDNWSTDTIRANVKYDGVRLLSKWSVGESWRYFTRNFNELDNTKMATISENLNELCKPIIDHYTKHNLGGFFVDGELEALGGKSEGENSSGARQSVTGNVNRILKGKAPDDIDKTFDYVLFDMEDSSVLEIGKGIKKYSERRDNVEALFNDLDLSNVSLAEEWIIDKDEDMWDKIRAIYKELISEGEEGLIFKHPDSIYEAKRSKFWIKMKEILSADLEVVELIEGTGKMVGTLGALVVKFSSGESCKVGSGFTEKERDDIWEKKDIVGRIVEVEYNAKSTDKHGKQGLFLPIYKGIRVDKTEAEKY